MAQLLAFIQEIDAQRGKKIRPEQADDRASWAQRIMDHIWASWFEPAIVWQSPVASAIFRKLVYLQSGLCRPFNGKTPFYAAALGILRQAMQRGVRRMAARIAWGSGPYDACQVGVSELHDTGRIWIIHL